MKKILVCGAGGFIGAHLVKRLVREGYWVRCVDLQFPPYASTHAHDFIIGDLRDPLICTTRKIPMIRKLLKIPPILPSLTVNTGGKNFSARGFTPRSRGTTAST